MAIANTIQSMQSNLKSAYDKITDNDRRNLFDVSIWDTTTGISGTGSTFSLVDNGFKITSNYQDTFTNTGMQVNGNYVLEYEKKYLIKVKPNTRYTLSFNTNSNFDKKSSHSSYYCCCRNDYYSTSFHSLNSFDSNGKCISWVDTDEDTEYIGFRLGMAQSESGYITYTNIQLEESTTPSSYQPYIPPKNLQNLSTTIQSELDNIYSKVIDKGGSLRTKNLFDVPSEITYTADRDNWYKTTDYKCHLESGKTYTFNCITTLKYDVPSNSGKCLCYLMKDKGFSLFYQLNNNNKTINVEETGDYYLRVDVYESGTTNTFKNIQIEEGTTPTDYVPYEYEKNLYNLSKVIDSIPNE